MDKIKAIMSKEHSEPLKVAEVMRRMKAEYAQTGFYKSNDLKMILGNPKDGLGFTAGSYSAGNVNKLKQR